MNHWVTATKFLGLKGKRSPEDCRRLTAARLQPRSQLSPWAVNSGSRRATGRAMGHTGGGGQEGKDSNLSAVVTPGTPGSPLRPAQPLQHCAAFILACHRVADDLWLLPMLGVPMLFAPVSLPTPVWLAVAC